MPCCRKLTILLVLILTCCLSTTVYAQNDSTWLDLGVLKLKRTFTQSVTIKGTELEKMPFTDLSDAINVWLQGVYSNFSSLIYAVDGNILSDVNTYSIFDIEEIVFIRNAVVQINGATGQTQLVLITTRRRGPGGSGLILAGQTGLVNRDFSRVYPGAGLNSNTNFYHHYYAGFYGQNKFSEFGLSGDYFRDALPSVKADSIRMITPFNLNRFQLRAFWDIRLGTRNQISVNVNYAPQKIDSSETFYVTGYYNSQKSTYNGNTQQQQHLFSPWIRWTSEWVKGLRNSLQGSWLDDRFPGRIDANNKPDTTQGLSYFDSHITAKSNRTQVLVRDRLEYALHSGGWDIVPAFNASYEHVRTYDSTAFADTSGSYTSFGYNWSSAKGHIVSLTPSLELDYKNAFSLQGGVLWIPSKSTTSSGDRFFPLVTFTTALLHIRPISWKIYGSASRDPQMIIKDYAYANLRSANGPLAAYSTDYLLSGGYGANTVIGGVYPFYPGYGISGATYWCWQAGTGFSFFGDRLQFDYNFEKRFSEAQILSEEYVFLSGFVPILIDQNVRFLSENLALQVKILDKKDISWSTIINTTTIKAVAKGYYNYYYESNINGDYGISYPSWTGGWVNRWRYKALSLGVSMLYHLNEKASHLFPLQPSDTAAAKTTSFLLQNLFLAYDWKRPVASNRAGWKTAEVFLTGRNLWQNKSSDLTDGSRYYGLGGKVSF